MGTIADKLNLLRKTKENMKSAIEEKGQTVGDIPFAQYPNKIRAISGGGGTGGGGMTIPPDPVEVYKNTRPKDWLPMPDPEDNEIYLLVHIPDGASALLAFTVTCTVPNIMSYVVGLGTVQDGQFVLRPGLPAFYKGTYETELFADEWGDLTSDGYKQVMVKISGAPGITLGSVDGVIETWELAGHSKRDSYFCSWPIVEISCRLPAGKKVACAKDWEFHSALTMLRYFAWAGPNAVTDMRQMFAGCTSLVAVLQLDTSSVTDMFGMFGSCAALTAIPQFDTSLTTNMNSMFYGCDALITIPQLDTSKVTDMAGMFSLCSALTTIPPLDTSLLTSTEGMFDGCCALTVIKELAIPVNGFDNRLFDDLFTLASIKINPNSVVSEINGSINLGGNSCLGRKALVALFESLPKVSLGELTLYGNPGVDELTDEEKAIATDKGWKLNL